MFVKNIGRCMEIMMVIVMVVMIIMVKMVRVKILVMMMVPGWYSMMVEMVIPALSC